MTPADLLALVGPMAREAHAAHGVPASVTLAQAILESGWGESELATKASALFGIKYGAKWSEATSPYVRGAYAKASREYLSGQWVTVTSDFCRYDSWADSILDHGLFLRRPVYAGAFPVTSADDFARAIHRAGYATDPAYSDRLIELMRVHDLYRFDQEDPVTFTPRHIGVMHAQQPGNRCEAGDTERDHTHIIAGRVADLVNAAGHRAELLPDADTSGRYGVPDGSINFYDNVAATNARHKVDPFYFVNSIHTNALGGSLVAWYPGNALGEQVARAIKARLDPIAPDTAGTRDNLLVHEIAKTDPTVILTESYRHDTIDGARWIHANLEAIAQAHADGILDVIGRRDPDAPKPADPLVSTTPTPAPAPAPAPTGRLLRELMRGDDVRQLQREALRVFPSYAKPALGRWGADGFYGKETEQFVREFQRRHGHGLTVDGKVGNQTRAAMASYGMKGF